MKAMGMILDGRVTIETVTYTDDQLAEVVATVKGDTGEWKVRIDGDTTTCTCPYGTNRQDASGHSHDLAVRLAAVNLRGS